MGKRSEVTRAKCWWIEGPIGAGKTEIADFLNDTGHQVVEEKFDSPYLRDAYANPKEFSYKNQKWFIRAVEEHIAAHLERAMMTNEDIYFDRSLYAIYVFIEASQRMEWLTTEQADKLRCKLEAAIVRTNDVVARMKFAPRFIYVRADCATCYERIKKRCRPEEKMMNEKFLACICNGYENFFRKKVTPRIIFPAISCKEELYS